MKILGVSRAHIRRIFMAESLIIGFAGGFIGVITSIIIGHSINYAIQTMAISSGNTVVAIMYFPIFLVLLIMAIAVLISLLAGLYPAQRTNRISPLDSLRYE